MIIFEIIIVSVLIHVMEGRCESNCETCRDKFAGDYACLACKPGYELVTTYNICLGDTSINNCALYDQTLDCL